MHDLVDEEQLVGIIQRLSGRRVDFPRFLSRCSISETWIHPPFAKVDLLAPFCSRSKENGWLFADFPDWRAAHGRPAEAPRNRRPQTPENLRSPAHTSSNRLLVRPFWAALENRAIRRGSTRHASKTAPFDPGPVTRANADQLKTNAVQGPNQARTRRRWRNAADVISLRKTAPVRSTPTEAQERPSALLSACLPAADCPHVVSAWLP